MKRHQTGFSAIAGLLVIIVISLVGGIGYYVVSQNNKAQKTAVESSGAANSTTYVPAAGTTGSIDSLTAQDAASESKIDDQYGNNDQTAAQSATPAANAIGGSYDESSL
jgi:hypothetical protein